MRRLVVNPGTPQAWEIQLKPGTNLLGRNSGNDFVIQAPGISSRHCQIVVGDDSTVIQDLRSTNGTFIEHRPIQEASLLNGQSVQLGSVEMIYYSEESVTDADTEADAATASAPPIPPPLASVPAGRRFCITASESTRALRLHEMSPRLLRRVREHAPGAWADGEILPFLRRRMPASQPRPD